MIRIYNALRRNLRLWLILPVLFAGMAGPAGAQTKGHKVVGTVMGPDSLPLQGATVIIKEVNRGAVSDSKGRYVLSNVPPTASLVFSFLGMVSQEVPVGQKTEINVVLTATDARLDEVVVVGYSEVKYKDLTGSVGRANVGDMLKTDAGNIGEAFAGRVAGVQVTSNEGMPGEEMNIVIRGSNSITQSNSPLYVIDGFPLEDTSMGALNPSDIASISILKDASATAIYGARAANGVVIITTKLGTPGTTKVTFDASWGFAQISKKIDLMNAYEFVTLQQEIMTEADFNKTYLGEGGTIEDYRNVKSIDWQDQIFRTAPVQKYSVNLSGGNRSTRFSTTLSMLDQDGIIKNSNYSRYQGRATIDHRFAKKWHVQAMANYSRILQTGDSPSQTNYTGSANLLPNVWSYRPFVSVGDDDLINEWVDPSINPSQDFRVNPIHIVSDEYRKRINNYFRANAYVEYEIIKDLKVKVMGGFLTDDYSNEQFNGSRSRTGNKYRSDGVNASVQNKSTQQWVNENTLTYKTAFDKDEKHKFDILLGQTMQGSRYRNTYMKATHIPNEHLGINGFGEGSPVVSTYNSAEWTLMSFLSRINYNYDNRYYFTATFRADGSSKFAKNNRWGYFPSASAAWNISNEKFLSQNKVVSNLKLRASWGQTGNNRVSEYAYRTQMYATEGSEYPFDNSNTTGNIIVNLGNRNLKWETTTQWDAGVDLGLFRNRLTIAVDWYRKITSDLLLSADIPPSSGFSTNTMNIGKVRNQGWEFTLQTENFNTKNFRWTTDFNISFIRNELRALAGGAKEMMTTASWNSDYTGYDYTARIGQSLGLIYGYVFDGVYQTSDFNVNAATGEYVLKEGVTDITDHAGVAVKPGMVKYKDTDGDGVITTADRTVIGNGTPKWYGGITNTLSYKGVDLSFMFQFNYGNDVYNATRLYASQTQDQRSNLMAEVADRWTATNASNKVPAWDGYIKNEIYSRFIEDGSFLRLKNLTVGYTFPQQWTRKFYVSKLRLYFTAQNLFVVTGYSGYDPEVSMRASNPMTPSLDWGAYPKSKVYTFGIDLTF